MTKEKVVTNINKESNDSDDEININNKTKGAYDDININKKKNVSDDDKIMKSRPKTQMMIMI